MPELRLLIYSQIPLIKDDGFNTLDLWVQDLNAQHQEGISIYLLSEVIAKVPSDWQGVAKLNPDINVIEFVKGKNVAALLADINVDVLQIPGNMAWENSSVSRQIVRVAKHKKRPVIVGISSNRAKTLTLNAANQGMLKKIKAHVKALSIRLSQFYLTSVCEATFIVGDGLKSLVSPFCKNLYVGIASWISKDQIHSVKKHEVLPPLKLMVAARLDAMKGVHLAVEALRILIDKGHQDASLDIIGEGVEKNNLVDLVAKYGLDKKVNFLGTFAYPAPFLDRLSDYRFVLVTNLNDEQPRIVFDALSRMIIPICPDRVQFRALGLPTELLYAPGDANALANTLEQLSKDKDHRRIQTMLSALINEHTLESMHNKRKQWLLDSVLVK